MRLHGPKYIKVGLKTLKTHFYIVNNKMKLVLKKHAE